MCEEIVSIFIATCPSCPHFGPLSLSTIIGSLGESWSQPEIKGPNLFNYIYYTGTIKYINTVYTSTTANIV